jgi:endonuclease YncB( thermonuclease family)
MRIIIGLLAILLTVTVTVAGAEEKTAKPHSTKTIATLTGRVARVVSGDMFILVTPDHARRLIRISYIDAPEWNQPYFKEAKAKLTELLKSGKVKVDYYKI